MRAKGSNTENSAGNQKVNHFRETDFNGNKLPSLRPQNVLVHPAQKKAKGIDDDLRVRTTQREVIELCVKSAKLELALTINLPKQQV